MARLRATEPAPAAARPQWLSQFRWRDWDDPAAPLDPVAAGFNAGTQANPAEERWIRLVLAARRRWNAARAAWFSEHGEGENFYRVRLTGRTHEDTDDEGEGA